MQDEYGSARNTNFLPNTFGTFFSGILSKKQEINTFHDTAKKKPPINTKDAWLVTQRSKLAVDAWFRDLSTGAKTLTQLSRKVPIFNKKEEIFLQLYEFQIPMLKAAWFIKMSSAYSLALSGNYHLSTLSIGFFSCLLVTYSFCSFSFFSSVPSLFPFSPFFYLSSLSLLLLFFFLYFTINILRIN